MSRTKSPSLRSRCLTFGIRRGPFCRRGDPRASILLVLMRNSGGEPASARVDDQEHGR